MELLFTQYEEFLPGTVFHVYSLSMDYIRLITAITLVPLIIVLLCIWYTFTSLSRVNALVIAKRSILILSYTTYEMKNIKRY